PQPAGSFEAGRGGISDAEERLCRRHPGVVLPQERAPGGCEADDPQGAGPEDAGREHPVPRGDDPRGAAGPPGGPALPLSGAEPEPQLLPGSCPGGGAHAGGAGGTPCGRRLRTLRWPPRGPVSDPAPEVSTSV